MSAPAKDAHQQFVVTGALGRPSLRVNAFRDRGLISIRDSGVEIALEPAEAARLISALRDALRVLDTTAHE